MGSARLDLMGMCVRCALRIFEVGCIRALRGFGWWGRSYLAAPRWGERITASRVHYDTLPIKPCRSVTRKLWALEGSPVYLEVHIDIAQSMKHRSNFCSIACRSIVLHLQYKPVKFKIITSAAIVLIVILPWCIMLPDQRTRIK